MDGVQRCIASLPSFWLFVPVTPGVGYAVEPVSNASVFPALEAD